MAIKGSHSLEKRAGNEGGMWVERKGGNCNSYADPAVAPQVRRWLGLWGGGQERERVTVGVIGVTGDKCADCGLLIGTRICIYN